MSRILRSNTSDVSPLASKPINPPAETISENDITLDVGKSAPDGSGGPLRVGWWMRADDPRWRFFTLRNRQGELVDPLQSFERHSNCTDEGGDKSGTPNRREADKEIRSGPWQ